jgi:hypothetical protein
MFIAEPYAEGRDQDFRQRTEQVCHAGMQTKDLAIE